MSQIPLMAICLPSMRCKLPQNWCNCKPWSRYKPAARVCPVSTDWSQSLLDKVLPESDDILSLCATIRLCCAVGTVHGIFLLIFLDCGRSDIIEASGVYCANNFAANGVWGDTRKACMEWCCYWRGLQTVSTATYKILLTTICQRTNIYYSLFFLQKLYFYARKMNTADDNIQD